MVKANEITGLGWRLFLRQRFLGQRHGRAAITSPQRVDAFKVKMAQPGADQG